MAGGRSQFDQDADFPIRLHGSADQQSNRQGRELGDQALDVGAGWIGGVGDPKEYFEVGVILHRLRLDGRIKIVIQTAYWLQY